LIGAYTFILLRFSVR